MLTMAFINYFKAKEKTMCVSCGRKR